tara:strand:+ start:116370 stop:117944 length:1575 start_codon:yes stop_codon:yes gene_type:complete
MKKVLFTLLKSDIEIIKSARVINSYLQNNPHTEVSLLCYQNSHEACSLVKNITNIYTIDSEKIATYLNGEIYPDVLACNVFGDNLKDVVATQWDTVVNLSNDNVSAYLISGLHAEEVIGSHIGNFGSVITTNEWNTYLNSICAKESFRTISATDIKSNMLLSPIDNSIEVLKIDNELASTASVNFNKIRLSKGSGKTKVVGVSLSDGRGKEYIDTTSLVELIDVLESSNEYKIVLISSGEEYEKEIVNSLNAEFNNSLITISAQKSALTAIMSNLDALVSCSNFALATAEACETFTIELVNAGNQEILEKEGNFVIHTRGGFVDDIVYLLNTKYETVLPVHSTQTENSIYETLRDDFGYFKSLVHGEVNLDQELNYHLKRCYNYSLMGYPVNHELLRNLKEKVPAERLMDYIETSKEEITLYVKTLLGALRSLKSTKETGQNTDKFIKSLDVLITSASDNTLASGALGLLDGRIENISSTDVQDNINQIEKYLFELKSDLQQLTNIFGELVSTPKRNKNINQEA